MHSALRVFMIYLLRRSHPLQLLVAQHLRQQQQQPQPEPGVNIDHANMATVPGHSVVPSSQPCQVSLRGHWKVGTSVVVVVVAVAVSNSSLRIAFGHLPSPPLPCAVSWCCSATSIMTSKCRHANCLWQISINFDSHLPINCDTLSVWHSYRAL